ncbi:HNH endonuclease [Salinisphaera sp. LB1]|uniref:HNH endonuclease n=1 Tax=Salinisphaera sp. LB1 TaxID=2183911 RepID=UPI000D7080F5|nr:HNH endonuclease [Salinisphaera sp. LB1]
MESAVDQKTKALTALYEKYRCEHPTTKLRLRTVRGGATQRVLQCVTCGEATSRAFSKQEAQEMNGGNEPPAFDDALLRNWKERYNAETQQIIGRYKTRSAYERAEFFRWYDKYLKSSKWKEKREKVLLRAQGVCEGCRETAASEVHHLTYRNVGDELLFQLVAVCNSCHKRLHDSEDEFPES